MLEDVAYGSAPASEGSKPDSRPTRPTTKLTTKLGSGTFVYVRTMSIVANGATATTAATRASRPAHWMAVAPPHENPSTPSFPTRRPRAASASVRFTRLSDSRTPYESGSPVDRPWPRASTRIVRAPPSARCCAHSRIDPRESPSPCSTTTVYAGARTEGLETSSYAIVTGGDVGDLNVSSPSRGAGVGSPAFGAVTSHPTTIRYPTKSPTTVTPDVDVLPQQLLGRCVGQGSDDLACLRLTRYAEVEDPHGSVLADEDPVGRDARQAGRRVAPARLVHRLEPAQSARRDRDMRVDGCAMHGRDLGERSAGHVLHDRDQLRGMGHDPERRDDIRMIHPRRARSRRGYADAARAVAVDRTELDRTVDDAWAWSRRAEQG